MSDSDKKVEIKLDQAFVTNGYYHGHVDGDPKKPFIGKTSVTMQEADDLERRKADWAKYDASRHRNNGHQISAGALTGGGS